MKYSTWSDVVMMYLSIQQQATSCSEAPSAVHDAQKNKSIKAGALLLTPLIQGGAEL